MGESIFTLCDGCEETLSDQNEMWKKVITGEILFDFGLAIRLMKKGYAVTRKEWSENALYVYLVEGSTVSHSQLRNEAAEHNTSENEDASIQINSHLDMKTSNGIVVGWTASQTDLLSNDWCILK